MASRRKLVAGNWKMHGSLASSAELALAVSQGVANFSQIDVLICPVSAHLNSVAASVGKTLKLGAQNAHPNDSGAFTGELSMAMLADLGCEFVLVGHSERRQLFSETNAVVADKVEAALQAGVTPILCIGETLEEREAGQLESVIHAQIGEVLARIGIDAFAKLVIAYEPVWAIGTGKTASPEQAQEVHAMIRSRIADESQAIAEGVQILYGGSVKPDNAADLFSQADIDGGLIGGAALDADSFTAICQAASAA